MKEMKLHVKGMVCAGCEERLKKSLATIPEVEDVQADYKKGEVKVCLLDSSKENVQDVIFKKIEDLDFEVEE